MAASSLPTYSSTKSHSEAASRYGPCVAVNGLRSTCARVSGLADSLRARLEASDAPVELSSGSVPPP